MTQSRVQAHAPLTTSLRGPYGRLFGEDDKLAPWKPDGASRQEIEQNLLRLSLGMKEDRSFMATTADQVYTGKVGELNRKFCSGVPAGYTYFGQFITHDMSFDPASSLQRENDPSALENFRTPRLDLDSLYGGGPDASPFLYRRRLDSRALAAITDEKEKQLAAHQHCKFLIASIPDADCLNQHQFGKLPDLPRNAEGIALVPDPRNDQNAIVSQLHLAFLLAHNTLVDRAVLHNLANPEEKTDNVFESARTTLRWLYQHLVWNDYLGRLCRTDILASALARKGSGWDEGLEWLYNWKNQPYMPVEFSVAAFRFGHSMIRPAYMTNESSAGGVFVPTFSTKGPLDFGSLAGECSLSPGNCLQWQWFLDFLPARTGFPQRAGKIDTSASNALYELPLSAEEHDNLPYRDLLRSYSFDLPAGTAVADRLGAEVLPGVSAGEDSLWYYILKEAEQQESGERLGKTGSMIVCATIAGLLSGDPESWISKQPDWHPDTALLLTESDKRDGGNWTLASIIRLAGIDPAGIGFYRPVDEEADGNWSG